MPGLNTISTVVGWTYVVCWSISLYPPVLLTRKLQSVEGLSQDFVVLNTVGYITYALSLSMLFFSSKVRGQYSRRHSYGGRKRFPLVRFNDIVYSYHGLALVGLNFVQVFCLGYKRGSNQHLTNLTKGIFAAGAIAALALALYQQIVPELELLDVAMILGNVKVLMSTAKYIPQIMYNQERRSTHGFSIDSIILDVIGSALSLTQLILDGIVKQDMRGILNNSMKLLLAAVTILFDGILIMQHWWYRDYAPRSIPQSDVVLERT